MRGIAGCSILRTERPGSAIGVHGGIHGDEQLAKVLVRMRAMGIGAFGGKLIVVCTRIEKEWRIGRLTGVRGQAPVLIDDVVFDNEQDAQHAIFLLRLDQYPETDGFPEHFHEGWKRRDDNWCVT